MADKNFSVPERARGAESAHDAFTLAMSLVQDDLANCETAEAKAVLRGLHANLFLVRSIQEQGAEMEEVKEKLEKIEKEVYGT